MRKLLLTVIALFLLSTQCLAANWELIVSNDAYEIFYDKNSVVFDVRETMLDSGKYKINRDKCYVWIKVVCDKEYAQRHYWGDTSYALVRLGFDLTNNRMNEGEKIYYNQDREVIRREKGLLEWESIIPDSLSEAIKKEIEKYVRSHTEEIEQRTRGK